MILLIAGASHTGKTVLAQRLMERHGWPYVSIDHIKMGLIRSGMLPLSPSDEEALTDAMWPMLREMVKTAVENDQNLILEGCYIPFDWRDSFDGEYLPHIRALWLVMTEGYIRERFADILAHGSAVENRGGDEGLDPGWLIAENARNLAGCQRFGCPYLLIDGDYEVDWQP